MFHTSIKITFKNIFRNMGLLCLLGANLPYNNEKIHNVKLNKITSTNNSYL